MAEENEIMKDGEESAAPAFEKPKPDYDKDPNVKARKRAAKRSQNRNSGKPIDEGTTEDEAGEVVPPVSDEGGIVKEAEEYLAEAKAEATEEETPAEQAAEEKTGEEMPAEEPAQEAASEEMPAEMPAPEATAEEAPVEEMPEEVGEYQAPEGESHDELLTKYHEAIAYGDIEQANDLYKKLSEHRYQENKYRGKKEAMDEAEAREHLAVAKALAAKHPELAEDGLPADKVLALADVYRNQGMKPAQALQKAVADLYPEQPTSTPEAVVPPVEEAPAAPMAEEAPAESSPVGEEAGEALPDMEERNMRKREIAEVPAASARNEPAPEPEKPTRSSAIQKMKEARGQR